VQLLLQIARVASGGHRSADLPVPNYSTLSRRAQTLTVLLPALRSGEPLHLVLDSTGLKLYGEGEWTVRKHGYSKRRIGSQATEVAIRVGVLNPMTALARPQSVHIA
jgi:hypothetical protein